MNIAIKAAWACAPAEEYGLAGIPIAEMQAKFLNPVAFYPDM